MTPNEPPRPTTELVRRTASYPAFLMAGRLYVGGILLMLASAYLVALVDADLWVLYAGITAGLPVLIIGAVLAWRGYQQFERELPASGEIRSAATIAAFQDLIRRR